MAATPFDPSLPSASFFDIYTDGAAARNAINLPGGGCNFVDLTPGANGAKCGCRRFWSRFAVGRAYAENLGSDNAVWCMCNHHACFHDDARGGEATPTGLVAGQENERPKCAREPLSPVQDALSFRMPQGGPPTLEFTNLDATMSFSTTRPEEPRPRQVEQASQRAESSLPDTLSWGDLLQSQPGLTTLPPIPPQCLMPSQPSSTTSSSQARYLRPFAGKGLQTLSGVSVSGSRLPGKGKPQDIDPTTGRLGEHVSKDDSSAVVLHGTHGSDTPRPQAPSVAGKQSVSLFAGPSRETFRHLSDTVQGHEQRLDRLENVSFSAAGHDDCHEKHDQADLRVTDLEVRVEEVEKLINDNSSHGTSHRINRLAFDESTNSVVSVATNATSRTIESSEIYSQIQSLQAQVVQLQSSLPSHNHPWEIEVVFLPFPLKKIWQEIHEFKIEREANVDEWTQLPNTNSSSTMRSQSPFYGEWADPGHAFEWLLPKACGARSITDRRLRSRGLIRTISVKGPDARSVQAAVNSAFANVFHEMSPISGSPSRRRSTDGRFARFLGLQHPWVPLRKIHKESRLRFLSPAEMVTPALWDVSFLNSVSMRSSEPRLFITQPEAYVQDITAYETGWTWQRLRLLSRVYPDSQATQEVPEADALEEYWAWNEQLDEPSSEQSSSLSLRQARQRISSSPSQQYFTIQSSMRSPSPIVTRGQSPIKDRKGSRPPNIRTTSMPPSLPTQFSPSQNKRRVASYGQQQKGSPQIRTSPIVIAQALKRRRTRSPTYPRNTPRWTASPSPMPPGVPGEERQPHVRGTTPFYYATPYSNAPLMETRPVPGTGSARDGYGSEEDDEEQNEATRGHGSTADLYDDDESEIGVEMVTHMVPVKAHDSPQSRQWQLPEDEPWPGIEDQDRMSDGENIDPLFSPAPGEEGNSEASSQPSEYPSTQRGWQLPATDDAAGFRIHEDDERMQTWN